jgi:hypothetical protein
VVDYRGGSSETATRESHPPLRKDCSALGERAAFPWGRCGAALFQKELLQLGGKHGLVSGHEMSSVPLEPISKSFEEDDEAGKLDKAEEIVGVVLPANEDPALPLNPGEEALDEPASHVAA